ncbi:MAG: ferric iron uptake transcriptional regulator [Gammaproteobacteria bacterium]
MKVKDLTDAGLKITQPRVKILQVLEQANPHHLSAEEVYKILLEAKEDVALATVYRVLTQFEQAGIVKRLNFEGGHSVFELAQGDHHDHMVCVQCHAVEEFIDPEIERRQNRIATQAGFQLLDHNLTLYGMCRRCALNS